MYFLCVCTYSILERYVTWPNIYWKSEKYLRFLLKLSSRTRIEFVLKNAWATQMGVILAVCIWKTINIDSWHATSVDKIKNTIYNTMVRWNLNAYSFNSFTLMGLLAWCAWDLYITLISLYLAHDAFANHIWAFETCMKPMFPVYD